MMQSVNFIGSNMAPPDPKKPYDIGIGAFLPTSPPRAGIGAFQPVNPPSLADLFSDSAFETRNPEPGSLGTLLELAQDSLRRREEWNKRFSYWEQSESDTEAKTIERARNMVELALSGNTWLKAAGVRIVPQGSFTNRTNTRNESDIDLRLQHPSLQVLYAPGVDPVQAWSAGNYRSLGRTYGEENVAMRAAVISDLCEKFGEKAVDASGKKAIRVNGLEGSRAEVDVVPCFTLHHVTDAVRNLGHRGVAILGTDGAWTFNYPDQHIANGRAKRFRTGLKFKRVVRIIKRMQADMIDKGSLEKKVPSFLIECLVYLVGDEHFTVQGDDRYDLVKRVLVQILERLYGIGVFGLTEINGIKPLFGEQAWSVDDARGFTVKAIDHLGQA